MHRFFNPAALFLLFCLTGSAEPADWIYTARYVVTMDAQHRLIDDGAVAVRGERIVGLVFDAVSDVYSFSAENIQPPPEGVGSINQMFVLGLAKHENKLVIVLDIGRLVISSVLGDTKAA